ncbi:hypothetical protein MTO96_024125 [Rhipicephalus appendiculatus]
MMPGKLNAPVNSDNVEGAMSNLKGRVSVVKEGYGFIDIEDPLRATVFAHRSSVVNPRLNDKRNFGLKEGDNVELDIERSPAKFKARFQAVRVRLLESEVNFKQPCYPSVPAPCQGRGEKISNQCISGTLVRPEEKVSAIFSVGDKVCFDAHLVTDIGTGTTQWQATLVTTVMRENYSRVFDIDLVAPTSERYASKSDFITRPTFVPFAQWQATLMSTVMQQNYSQVFDNGLVAPTSERYGFKSDFSTNINGTKPLFVPFASDPRAPFPKSSWNPAMPTKLTGTTQGPMFNTHVTPTSSQTVVTQSSAVVAKHHGEKDKPTLVPPGCDSQWTYDGRSSMEPNIAAPANGHPVLAGYDRPSKAETPERTSSESAPFTINSRGIGPATSSSEKQLAPQASDKPSTTALHQRQPDMVVTIKHDTSYQHDQVPKEKMNVDSICVNNISKGDLSESFSPRPPSPECLVSTHNDVRGVVAQVHERSAIVSVEQGGLTNYTEVQAFAFYKDGKLIKGDLRRVLRVGDEVMMDFMSGSTGYDLMTHCNMAWQGQKPQGVECVSREAFQSTLGGIEDGAGGGFTSCQRADVSTRGGFFPDHNVSSVDNCSTSTEPEEPRFEAVEVCDADKGAGEYQELVKATAELVVKSLRHVIREEIEALRLEFFGHMDIAAGAVNARSSDHRGFSSKGSRAVPHPRQPQNRSDESCDIAAEADRLELLDLHEDDLQMISSLINEGTQAILKELRRLRLQFRRTGMAQGDRCA